MPCRLVHNYRHDRDRTRLETHSHISRLAYDIDGYFPWFVKVTITWVTYHASLGCTLVPTMTFVGGDLTLTVTWVKISFLRYTVVPYEVCE